MLNAVSAAPPEILASPVSAFPALGVQAPQKSQVQTLSQDLVKQGKFKVSERVCCPCGRKVFEMLDVDGGGELTRATCLQLQLVEFVGVSAHGVPST